ncbi:Gfo/Idh/MocA family oxidoreductase [Blastopirellula sp. J2-11]|uniref:Gfo/Idh/MocA family protein n=1 Tax=Blastopirellula sp. J2-11 TaxID=2943192 RepID=UPI0021C70AC4|nr:Gfo/Idh/MocA family oxidoreductase [Blastopirellula sp. J2-11]UUO05431.1 Gfo/Idh/MocA family oxidoreductase [Blastopirellula sp. J2-11]
MTMNNNRRDFLKVSAAAGVGFWASNMQAAESKSPNEQINFACIGVQGKGSSDSRDASRAGNIVAICDIDDNNLNKAAADFEGAKKYNDYRKMLDEMDKEIDAVTVSTPDHCHAVVSATAMKAGKHCFTQKPLTHSIYEARRLGEIARENKVMTQMGNQGTSHSGLRRAAEVIQSGAIGNVQAVHVWTNRPIWPQGQGYAEVEPTPENIHWDNFIGPAKAIDYRPDIHPFKWRGFWEFGTGALGDMACHTVNMPYMALKLRDPTSVEAVTSGHNGITYPKWSTITFEFPELNGRPACQLFWYDGGKMPDNELLDGVPRDGEGKVANSGCLLIGDKGRIYSSNDYGAIFQLLPEAQYKDYEGPEKTIPRSPGHFKEFADAIKGGPEPMSNFPNYAGPLTETILLGNLSVWAGKKIDWDAKNMVAKNAPEVAEIIKPTYREGYSL